MGAIIVSDQSSRQLVQNLTIIATAGTASATSVGFAIKIKRSKNYVASAIVYLALGLVLWLAAEIVWTYYVNIMQIEIPFPSIADIFYLAGYLPVGISLYVLTRSATGVLQENKIVITTIAVTITAFITNVFLLQIVDSAIGFTQLTSDEAVLLTISIAYPLLDGFLLIPAIIALYSFRKNSGHFTWLMVSLSIVLMAAADTGFGYTALANIEALSSETTWDILFNISYVLMATGMVNGLLTNQKELTIAQTVKVSK